jgi:hypothetical protein
MSAAFLLIAAAIYILARWIDMVTGNQLFGSTMSLLLAIAVLNLAISQYENPRRQIAGIKEQTTRVSFLSTNGALYTDNISGKYIEELKKVAINTGWEKGMALIDMTGGTPGASVILGSKILGRPWLIGGYPNSTEYAKTILSLQPRSILESAWVLEAPQGKRSLPIAVLNELELDFPGEYKQVGKFRTGHRNEEQVLWRPK